jgi:hypothetical protein
VTAINLPGTAIPVGAFPAGVAITPDGSNAYFTNSGGTSVTPINLPGTAIPLGIEPEAVAIGPDQAPTAAFSTVAEAAGQPSSFDASQSSSPVLVEFDQLHRAIGCDGRRQGVGTRCGGGHLVLLGLGGRAERESDLPSPAVCQGWQNPAARLVSHRSHPRAE